MLTHVHKVIHKVVDTFTRVLRGREKSRLSLPPTELAGFGEETETKRSLKATGRWPWYTGAVTKPTN
jgi:hypothetical protein